MKIATYEFGGVIRSGVLDADGRLHAFEPEAGTDGVRTLIERGGLRALLEAGDAALARAAGSSVDEVRLLAPLRPASIRDSVSFEAHIEGARKSQEGAKDAVPERWYEAPCFYFTKSFCSIYPQAGRHGPRGVQSY